MQQNSYTFTQLFFSTLRIPYTISLIERFVEKFYIESIIYKYLDHV